MARVEDLEEYGDNENSFEDYTTKGKKLKIKVRKRIFKDENSAIRRF